MMTKIYRLESFQKIPVSSEKAWEFFSNAHNLLKLTPPFLNLKPVNDTYASDVYEGQTIQYYVKPLFGIPVKWITEITKVVPQQSFIDEQRKGPYKLWRHEHTLTPILGGVEMQDRINYSLPFGYLGNLAHSLFVKRQLKKIFDYRFQKIIEIFGEWKGDEKRILFS